MNTVEFIANELVRADFEGLQLEEESTTAQLPGMPPAKFYLQEMRETNQVSVLVID